MRQVMVHGLEKVDKMFVFERDVASGGVYFRKPARGNAA
jgi:hypothetical protein